MAVDSATIVAALSRKNWWLMKKAYKVNLLGLLLPVIMAALLGVLRQTEFNPSTNCIQPLSATDEFYCAWQPFNPVLVQSDLAPALPFGGGASFCSSETQTIHYAPNTTENTLMVQTAIRLIQERRNGSFANAVSFGYASEAEIISAYGQISTTLDKQSCFIGVVFSSPPGAPNLMSLRMPYTPGGFTGQRGSSARSWLTGNVQQPTTFYQGPRASGSDGNLAQYGSSPGYPAHQFLSMQWGLSKAFAEVHSLPESVTANFDGLSMQRMPFPEWTDYPFPNIFTSFGPFILMFGYLFVAATFARDVTGEKELKIKAGLMTMGLKLRHHWIAWWIRGMLPLFVSAILAATVIKATDVLEQAHFTIIFAIFLLYSAATISFACLVTTIVQKASIAAFIASIGNYLMFLPYELSFQNDPNKAQPSLDSMKSMCFGTTSCFAIALSSMAQNDLVDKPLSWGEIGINTNEFLAVGTCMVYLLFDTIIYFLLALYIEQVRPGDYGIPRPLLFPIYDILSCFNKNEGDEYSINDGLDRAVREPLDDSRQTKDAGIVIHNLTKEFHNAESNSVKRAVDNLSLSMYSGEITALLGQNGAGKTTTMSMLCGLFPPTSGTMQVAGHNVESALHSAQSQMGVCPQHDVLWRELSVSQHLELFARLKGVSSKDLKEDINSMLEDLQLAEKSRKLSKTLSGGQKRRLSVGVALIGGSSVVILDEPSSGCDPEARQAIWGLLRKHKANRTILLSTHFMDEADSLGDQIAIVSSGALVCAGSPHFLKNRYGVGHTLTIAKLPGCDEDILKSRILGHIADAGITSEIGSELLMSVPSHAINDFPALLHDLERNRTDLKIDSFGVSATTMEEVFLTAGVAKGSEGTEDDIDLPEVASVTSVNTLTAPLLEEEGGEGLNAKLLPNSQNTQVVLESSFWQQFLAIRYKRILLFRRSLFMLQMLLVVPAALFVFGAYTNSTAQSLVADNSVPRWITDLYISYSKSDVQLFCDAPDCSSNTNLQAATSYLQNQTGVKVTSWTGKTLQDYINGLNVREGVDFNANNAVGLGVSANSTIAWFNGQDFHSVAQSLAVAANTFLYPTGHSIQIVNFPLPKTAKETAASGDAGFSQSFSFAFMSVFALVLFAAGIVDHPTAERGSNVKHMQFNTGVKFPTYWLANFSIDFMFGLVLSIIGVIVISVGEFEAFSGDNSLSILVITFILSSASIILLCYFASNFFDQSATALKTMLFVGIFLGLLPMIVVSILNLVAPSVSSTVTSAFLWSPWHCLGLTIINLSLNQAKINAGYQDLKRFGSSSGGIEVYCQEVGCETNVWAFTYPGIGLFMIGLACQIVVWSILIYMVEDGWFKRIGNKSATHLRDDEIDQLDEDVAYEQRRILEMNESMSLRSFTEPIILNSVFKDYGTKVAVDRVSIGIPSGELFGLLGVNGAGKTTLFKMLTGELSPGSGSVTIDGSDVQTELRTVQKVIGYVPQFDALIGEMTAKELIAYFARLRGVKQSQISGEVDRLISQLDLTKHADNRCKKYSGGNKRKLCVAIALIGNPPVLLLDEPTTGMDPGSKRFLWNVLLDLIREGRTIVLTTHSMEECAALCTRMGIMVAGQLRCLGSQQHLKERFGKTVYIELTGKADSESSVNNAIACLRAKFPQLVVESQNNRSATVAVDGPNNTVVSIADLFETMLGLRRDQTVNDFTVSQCSLDQIFIRQAKMYNH